MITVKNLTKTYSNNHALDNVSVEFEVGKIYGVLGRNGAGKTTLINIITNRAFASSGTVLIDGHNSYENDYAQGKIFCITEQSLYPAGNKVQVALRWAKRFYPNFDTEYALELCNKFGVDTKKKYSQLSTGYSTIVKVIITLASNAPVMIFDEPVLGIDAIYRETYYEELKKTHTRLNNTIIIATHILDEIEAIVDKAIILKCGKIVFNNSVQNIGNGKTLQQFYLDIHRSDSNSKENLNAAQNLNAEQPKFSRAKIDRSKLLNTMRYGLSMTWINLVIPVPIYIILLIAGGIIGGDFHSMLDVIGLGNTVFIGVVVHSLFFKYAIYNGISRKTYYIASIIYFVGFALIAALFAAFASMVSHYIGTQLDISYLLYGFNFGSTFVWLFSASLCIMFLCILCLFAFNRLTRRGRYLALIIILSVGIFTTLLSVFAPSISPINVITFILGLKFQTPNPWFSSMCLFLLAVAFAFAGWLILRKQELR